MLTGSSKQHQVVLPTMIPERHPEVELGRVNSLFRRGKTRFGLCESGKTAQVRKSKAGRHSRIGLELVDSYQES